MSKLWITVTDENGNDSDALTTSGSPDGVSTALSAFWAKLEDSELERLDAWLDVEPALCASCGAHKRTVLLGVCADCAPKS